jgi:hypothetical protein
MAEVSKAAGPQAAKVKRPKRRSARSEALMIKNSPYSLIGYQKRLCRGSKCHYLSSIRQAHDRFRSEVEKSLSRFSNSEGDGQKSYLSVNAPRFLPPEVTFKDRLQGFLAFGSKPVLSLSNG